MVDSEQISASKAIQQQTGRTFHFATRLLPRRVRYPTYILYAFFRVADEVVDAAETAPPPQQRAELERLAAEALGEQPPTSPVLAAFAETVETYAIDRADIEVFIDAMAADITTDAYGTLEQLRGYMDGSAAAVGRMMTTIMGPELPAAALPHATALGEAFQLTNFLRDVREDVIDRDRVYLPRETLHAAGTTPEAVRALEWSPGFATAVEELLERTEELYREGVAGIRYLPKDCQFGVLLAAILYAEHHRLIRAAEYDVLAQTPQLGPLRKLRLLVAARVRWTLRSDPEAVFAQVSAVPATEAGQETPMGGFARWRPRRVWRWVEAKAGWD
jgi:phytoene synthase (EC 2.5.1.32)